VKLISTLATLKAYEPETIHLTAGELILSGNSSSEYPTNSVIAHLDPRINLPTSYAISHSGVADIPKAYNTTVETADQENHNITPLKRNGSNGTSAFGHMSFRRIQFLMRSGILAKSQQARHLHATIGKLKTQPKCAACQFAKAKRPLTTQNKTHAKVANSTASLKKNTLLPGQEVSINHFICWTLGRLYTRFGKTDNASLYRGGCIFVDNTTGLVHVEHQTSLTSHETLVAKERFEFACRDYGIIIQGYLYDNGAAFSGAEFSNHLARSEQAIRFASVGAHHYNGIAEKSIQDVMSIARTLLLHAAIHWPYVADAQLWLMAVDHAIFLHNHMPREDSGLTPHDLFSKQR
jgi:hypothetical protein